MPPTTSWDRSSQSPDTPSEVQRGQLHNVGQLFVDITPSRLTLFQHSIHRNLTPEPPVQHREALNQWALALIGGPLRSPIAIKPRSQHDRSASHSSSLRSVNQPPSIVLIDLPVDLLRIILDYLDWESLTTFRRTNKFFGELVLVSNLKAHYTRCRNETARDEEWLVKEGAKRFTSRSLSGPMYCEEMRAQALMGDMKRMPCYRCLRWFRCPMSKVLAESRKSQFSDMMAKAKDREGIDRYLTRSRLCFDCGVKTNYYLKGGLFKRFVICFHCGQLGHDLTKSPPQDRSTDKDGKKYWNGIRLKQRYYCKTCIDSSKAPETYAEHMHKQDQICKYERAMWKKRETCKAKRKTLGREKPDEKNPWLVWCPVIQKESICNCWKHPDQSRAQFDAYVW